MNIDSIKKMMLSDIRLPYFRKWLMGQFFPAPTPQNLIGKTFSSRSRKQGKTQKPFMSYADRKPLSPLDSRKARIIPIKLYMEIFLCRLL